MKKRFFTVSLVLAVIMLSACQETPEKSVVIGKDSSELSQIIHDTDAAPAEYDFPAAVTDTVGSGDLSVVIDADVIVPNTDTIPVVRATPLDLTQEQADLILNELVGNAQLISIRGQDEAAAVMTKEDIIERIGELQTMLQSPDIDSSQEESIRSDIARLQEALDTASVESEVLYADRVFTRPASKESSVGTISEEDRANMSKEELEQLEQSVEEDQKYEGASAVFQSIEGACDLDKDIYATISICKYDNPINSYVRFVNSDSDARVMNNLPEMIQEVSLNAQIADLNISCQDAYQQALNALSNMGISGLELVKTAEVPMGDPSVKQNEWPYCYMFVFSRPVNGISCTYALAEGAGQEQVSEIWPQEYIKIYIDGSGIVQFNWDAPTQVGETVNENVSIKSFDDIMAIFKQQVNNQNIYNSDAEIIAREIHIDEITLGMMKIKLADGNGYMFVPVWDFFGYSVNTYTDNTQLLLDGNNQKTIDEFGKSYLTINALDGSMIDRGLGY